MQSVKHQTPTIYPHQTRILTCFLSRFMGRRVVTMIKIVIIEIFVVAAVFVKFAIVDRTIDEWS